MRSRRRAGSGRPVAGLVGASHGTVPRRLSGASILLLDLAHASTELTGADDLVGLAGPMDDQHPGLRITAPSGVEPHVRGAMALMMAMSMSGHVPNRRADPGRCRPYVLRMSVRRYRAPVRGYRARLRPASAENHMPQPECGARVGGDLRMSWRRCRHRIHAQPDTGQQRLCPLDTMPMS